MSPGRTDRRRHAGIVRVSIRMEELNRESGTGYQRCKISARGLSTAKFE